ncbi:MAG: beta-galactosidase, partial [Armatimonadetes bacterium]|nr:beta-galactosidase [Armatimonadota bacterium]
DPAVQDGSPVLRCSSLEAEFDDVVISASDYAGSPEEIAMERPPVQVTTIPQVRGQATGFFHVEKHGDIWWLIAPNGEGFYAIGTDHCRFSGHWCEKLGYAPYERVTREKYGTPEKWAEEATRRLKSWNFNLIGAGGDPAARYRGLAHTEFISFGSSYAAIDPLVKQVHWTGFPNVFSPDWPRWCDKLAYRYAKANRADPWLFGYFLDNELEWFGKSGKDVGLAIEAAKLPPDNPAKKALVDLLRRRHGTIEALNQAWGAKYASWEDLAHATELSGTNEKTVHDDLMAFVAEAAELYFRVTAEALKRHDPNHLNLGCRFAGWAPEPAWRAAGKYCDIVTFNYYGGVDLDTETADGLPDAWVRYYELCGRPMMITEWSFPALDSGLPCTAGAGMRVDTQEQKARCYEVYQRLIFSLPFMVGSDYFMWVDEPALGISSTFPEDSNYGLVNEQDEPYEVLTATATRVNAMAYWLHSGLAPDIQVRHVQRRDGKIQALVANTGGSEAECDVAFVVNGEKAETVRARVGAGQEVWVAMTRSPNPPVFVRAIADPDRKLAEKRWDNNRADLVDAAGVPWPQPPAGQWLARIPGWASTGTLGFLDGVVVSVPADALRAFGPPEQIARRLVAFDAAGQPLPCQLEPWDDGWRVAVKIPHLPADSG